MFLLTAENVVDIPTLQKLAEAMIDKIIYFGWKIIVAVIVYIIGQWLISLLMKVAGRILIQRKVDPTVRSFLSSSASILLKVLLIIVVIGILGFETASFAAVMAALAFAVGVAMKDNLSNFAGGILILITKPFILNDRIIVQGQDGVVKSIGFIHTVLRTGDGKTVYVPNGSLMANSIVNISNAGNLRIDLVFSIPYGNDSKGIKDMIENLVNSNPLILKVPEPSVMISSVKDGNFDIAVKAWATNANYGKATSELNESIYELLESKKIYTPTILKVKMEE